MPTVADLERLEALVTNLRDLNTKQRGELIEAEAWNRLVSAVIDIGRATIDDTSDEVARHSHNDQVSLEWLDPKLRGIILEGGLGSPSSTAQLSKLERQLEKFSRTLAEFADRLNRIQSDVSGVATRDVEREASVGTALRKIDGVFDAREDIASLRGSLRIIESEVRTAADLSGRLQDDEGEDIDFNSLAGQINALEALGERLTLPDGGAFDGDAYARDLAQLRAELVTEAELNEALSNIENDFSGDLRNELFEGARTAALEANADALAGLSRDLRADQDASIRTLEESLDGRIAAATGDLSNQILTDARNEQTAMLDERLAGFGKDRDTEIDRRLGLLTDDVTRQLDGLSETVRDDVAAAVTKDVDAQLADFETTISGIGATTAALDEQLSGLTRSLNTTAARIETVSRDLQAADSRLNAQLTERIGAVEAELDLRIKDAADTNRLAMQAERETEMAVMRDQLTVQMTRTLRDVARTEIAMATTQLRGEMTEIAAAEIDAGMADMRTEMREAATVSDAQLAGLVSAEVRRATSDLDDRIAIGIEARQPTIERDFDPVLVQPVIRG